MAQAPRSPYCRPSASLSQRSPALPWQKHLSNCTSVRGERGQENGTHPRAHTVPHIRLFYYLSSQGTNNDARAQTQDLRPSCRHPRLK
ncbi:hypothetical protein C2E23DRAFT_853974 [Lenzites betulinus]|nr:hypothetical protein C2E23DRAFT_853974 [Lenzites betulinus]